MSDDYEPAITDTATDVAGAESTITTRAPEAANAPVLQAGEAGDNPAAPPGRDARGPRVVSDATRAMLRSIAAKAAKAEASELAGVADDLVPMEAEAEAEAAAATPTPKAVAAPAPVVSVVPAQPPATPAPAPVAAPAIDVGKAALEQQRVQLEAQAAAAKAREDAIVAREAALAEREKLLPDRTAVAERPAATLVAWLKESQGITGDDEMKSALSDLIAEMSEIGLDARLPPDFKDGLESRKAVRAMRAWKAESAREQRLAAEQRAAADKQAAAEREKQDIVQRERQAVAQVSTLLTDPAVREQYRFLLDREVIGDADPAAIIIDVVKEQMKAGHEADWRVAAKYADDYFKTQAETTAKKAVKLQSLLSPKPAAAPAAAAPAPAAKSPSGAPGPAPTTQPEPTPTTDDDDPAMDRRDRRGADRRRLFAKHFKAQPAGQ